MPAIKSGLIKRDPFLEIKYKRQQYFVEYLTQEEINKIAEVDLVSPDLDRVRDIFLFACYTGHILQLNLRKALLVAYVSLCPFEHFLFFSYFIP